MLGFLRFTTRSGISTFILLFCRTALLTGLLGWLCRLESIIVTLDIVEDIMADSAAFRSDRGGVEGILGPGQNLSVICNLAWTEVTYSSALDIMGPIWKLPLAHRPKHIRRVDAMLTVPRIITN